MEVQPSRTQSTSRIDQLGKGTNLQAYLCSFIEVNFCVAGCYMACDIVSGRGTMPASIEVSVHQIGMAAPDIEIWLHLCTLLVHAGWSTHESE